jgi:uncharacterized damage-inducible protein DinB
MMLPLLRDLMAHAEWANAVFFGQWAKSPARDHQELRRRVKHVYDVQTAFHAMLCGKGPAWPADTVPAFDELKAEAQAGHTAMRLFVTGLEDADLARTINLPWFKNPSCDVSVADGIVQVAMHSQHHRGQLMTRLKDFGGEPANVDYVIWLWKSKPAADWA